MILPASSFSSDSCASSAFLGSSRFFYGAARHIRALGLFFQLCRLFGTALFLNSSCLFNASRFLRPLRFCGATCLFGALRIRFEQHFFGLARGRRLLRGRYLLLDRCRRKAIFVHARHGGATALVVSATQVGEEFRGGLRAVVTILFEGAMDDATDGFGDVRGDL